MIVVIPTSLSLHRKWLYGLLLLILYGCTNMAGDCLSALHLLQEKGDLIERNKHLETQLHAVILREIALARSSCGLRRQLSVAEQQITEGAQQLSVTQLQAANVASKLQVGLPCQCCLCWQKDNH